MYVTNANGGTISRANLDGTDGVNLGNLNGLLYNPNGIALDVAHGKMYVVNPGGGQIIQANLDGTGGVDLGNLGGTTNNPQGIALDFNAIDPTATPTPTDTVTPTPTDTATPSPTDTATPTVTDTPTSTPTDTATVTPTDTATPSPTDTATPTPTDTATDTPTSTPTDIAPIVSSSVRTDSNPTSATNVKFTVTFSKAVTGVTLDDFKLTTTGVTGASLSSVTDTGGHSSYTLTVNTGSGNGTLRLDVKDDNTILNGSNNPLGGPGLGDGDFITGEVYDVVESSTFKSQRGRDGWILESSETSNKGGTLNNTSSLLYVGDNAQNKQYKSILSFNTSGLPDNATITSVKLKIKVQGFVGGNMFSQTKILYNLVVDISKPYFGSSTGLVVNDFDAVAGKNRVGLLGSAPDVGWRTITLDSTAYDFVDTTGTTQLRLRFAKDDNDDLSRCGLQ